MHFVDEKLDSGKIILKRRVEIQGKDTENLLRRKVQIEEHKAYSMAIRKIFINN